MRELTIDDLLDPPIDQEALNEAIEVHMEKLEKARLKEAYIFENLQNHYLEIASPDEVDDFIERGLDTSVFLDLGELR